MSKDNPFIEPSYVYAPYAPMQVTPSLSFNVRRGWYVRAKLKHFESSRESWELAPGDLVRHISRPETTVGTIVNTKFEEVGGPYTKERVEMYDVIWGDHGPGEIEMTEIRAKSRKMNARWTPEIAQDINAFHGIDIESKIK